MTTFRLMLASALFGSLALPALALAHVGAQPVHMAQHRAVRHAPVHRIATTPEIKTPAAATAPKPAVTAAPLAATSSSATAATAVPGATAGTVVGSAPLSTPRATTATPLVTPAVPGAARTN